MSILDDVLNAGKNLATDLAQKAGVDASLTQGILDKVTPHAAADAPAAPAAVAATAGAPDAAAPAAAAPAEESLMQKVMHAVDKDGDGNPLNDITSAVTGLAGKLFNR